MTISLTDYPLIPALIKNFTAVVTCAVLSLSFTTSPAASTTIQIGINSQPFQILFATTKTPNCAQNPSFTLNSNPSFISESTNLDGLSGKVSVSGATLSNVGIYQINLNGVVDSQTVSLAFTIII